MKSPYKYHHGLATKVTGLLLAILFLAIPLTQNLHAHHFGENYTKTTSEKSISLHSEKCLICDYLAEHRGKQVLMAYPPTIGLINQTYTTLNTFVYTRIYKFTLQNFSNKGPPSLLA